MSYWMRFFVDGEDVPTLERIKTFYDDLNAGVTLDNHDLMHGDFCVAQIWVTLPDDSLFEDEIREFQELIEDEEDSNRKRRVEKCLANAKGAIGVDVRFGNRDVEATLVFIDPLWEWLHKDYRGLMQADDEGFYNSEGLVLECSF